MLSPLPLPPLPPDPLVSVVTAAHNYGAYIGECLASVAGQSYPRIEHVVIDDGSDDDTAAVVAAAAAGDARIVFERTANGGQTRALNLGVARCSGDVVLFLDADDRFVTGKVDAVLQAFRAHPQAGMVTHRLREVDAAGRPLGVYPPLGRMRSGFAGEDMLATGGFLEGLSATSGLGLRREVADVVFPLPGLTRFADAELAALAPLVTALVGIDEPLAEYRWHGANNTVVGAGAAGLMGEIDRRLATQNAAWAAQRQFLNGYAPDAVGRLSPLSQSRYLAELRYARARLDGDRAGAAEHHRELLATPGFGAQPALRRRWWELVDLLPDPLFAAAYRQQATTSPLRRALAHLPTRPQALPARVQRLRDRVAYQLDPRADRYVLEAGVLPALAALAQPSPVLFVGVEWYTRDYHRRHPELDLMTLDIDPARARYGAPGHLVGSVTDLGAHVPAGSLAAIVLSGVIGFGLDEPAAVEAALSACAASLRPGGWLVVGWNDTDDLRVVPLEASEALAGLEHRPLPPFGAATHPTFSPARHTFDFYRKPEGAAA